MCDTSQPNEVREYRQYFYNQTAQYFRQDGCAYKGVKEAYIWGAHFRGHVGGAADLLRGCRPAVPHASLSGSEMQEPGAGLGAQPLVGLLDAVVTAAAMPSSQAH